MAKCLEAFERDQRKNMVLQKPNHVQGGRAVSTRSGVI